MSNKRITDLSELTNPTTDDVFPVVDIATNTTTKVQLGNLPVPTSVTTALATKQDTLVSGTNIKTVNSTSLVGSGNVAVQETLVSGTNIKTINSTSLLGSGNITIAANPSGVAGAIQFSNGSAFASDAANLFWDDTNNRLGIGTNAPTQVLDIVTTTQIPLKLSNNQTFVRTLYSNNSASGTFDFINNYFSFGGNNLVVGSSSNLNARLGVVGSGSTSATTSLLVQNSAGTQLMKIPDGGARIQFGLDIEAGTLFGQVYIPGKLFLGSSGSAVFGDDSLSASAVLQANSTTKGFLPPRMTTTQKNAIATPASGLVVYDSTTNKLCCYNGSTWNDLF